MTCNIHLVMMTYNRLGYTMFSLPRLLADPSEEFSLTIWDNGSTDGTQDYLRTVRDQRIVDIVLSPTNRGQAYVTNKVWSESTADLLGKVDNDCLVTPGWTRTLTRAHEDIDNLGVVGCWHFFPKDFDYDRARHKIQQFGKHCIFRHPWIDGSSLLVKRSVYERFGPCHVDEYLSGFWIRVALGGYINGFYYPLIFQEHMDDPKSSYCVIKDKESFDCAISTTAGLQAGRYNDPMGRLRWRQEIIRNLLNDPYDPHYYVGWRRKFRRLKSLMREFIAGSASKKIS